MHRYTPLCRLPLIPSSATDNAKQYSDAAIIKRVDADHLSYKARYSRDAAEMQPRYSRDMVEMWSLSYKARLDPGSQSVLHTS